SGDSMAPLEAPKVPPQPHFPGLAAAGSVALAAVRGQPVRREARLKQFLVSARDIANGGAGRLEPEAGRWARLRHACPTCMSAPWSPPWCRMSAGQSRALGAPKC